MSKNIEYTRHYNTLIQWKRTGRNSEEEID